MRDNLAKLAATQEGLLSRAQITDLGISANQLRTYVRSGWLQRVAPRVYAVAGLPDTKRCQLRMGLLSLGGESWVSYEAAASLHGLDRSDPTAVEFTIERTDRKPVLAHQVHTTTTVAPLDRVDVDGFRTLSATRTVIDLAHARRGVRRVEAAIHSARYGLGSLLRS